MGILQRVQGLWSKEPNRVRPPVSVGGMSLNLNLGGTTGPQARLGEMQAYGTVGWLFAVVNRIASSVAAVDWRLYRRQPDGERTEVTNHPLSLLWENPNPFATREDLIEVSQQHLDLTGEAWWVLVRNGSGRVVEIWPVRPDRMRPIPDPQEYIAGYEYRLGSIVLTLDREDVVFVRIPSPVDPYRGMGPVGTILPDLDAERLAAQWTRNFFRNSAEPGGIIELDTTLDDEEFYRLTSRWKEQHQGVANSHRVAFLERGVWKDRKLTQRDMQFEQLRKLNRDTILGVFGMPLSVMGITESVNRANAEAGALGFQRDTIVPRLRRIRAALNRKLIQAFDPTLYMDFDDPVPQNRELNLDIAERGYMAGLLTLNEGRARLGEGEVPEGDLFKMPAPSPFTLGAPAPVARMLTRGVGASEARIHEVMTGLLATEAERLARHLEDAEL